MKLFFPAAVIVLASGACCCCGGDLDSLFEQIEREIDAGGGAGGGGGTGARAFASVPANEKVRIVDLSSEDAYYSDRSSIVGRECVTDTESSYNGDGWHGGAVHCGADSYYFYKAAYEDLGPK